MEQPIPDAPKALIKVVVPEEWGGGFVLLRCGKEEKVGQVKENIAKQVNERARDAGQHNTTISSLDFSVTMLKNTVPTSPDKKKRASLILKRVSSFRGEKNIMTEYVTLEDSARLFGSDSVAQSLTLNMVKNNPDDAEMVTRVEGICSVHSTYITSRGASSTVSCSSSSINKSTSWRVAPGPNSTLVLRDCKGNYLCSDASGNVYTAADGWMGSVEDSYWKVEDNDYLKNSLGNYLVVTSAGVLGVSGDKTETAKFAPAGGSTRVSICCIAHKCSDPDIDSCFLSRRVRHGGVSTKEELKVAHCNPFHDCSP